jgi:hypothetical protein
LSRGGDIAEHVFAFSLDMFVHADEYREVFHAMTAQSGVVVQRLLHKLLLELVRDDVEAATDRGATNALTVDAVAQFIAGGLVGLLIWWLNTRPRLSAAEVNELFRSLAMPTLAAVVK